MLKGFKLPLLLSLVFAAIRCQAAVPDDKDSIVFAIIGDFGSGSDDERQVADLVKSWNPAYIVTVGDNSYTDDEDDLLPQHVGAFYGDYIYNPSNIPKNCSTKACTAGHTLFYPVPGNHDHKNDDALSKYLGYFAVERNYRMVWGNVYLYFLDSGKEGSAGKFDAKTMDSIKKWTKEDRQPYFKLVFFHHPPYSTGPHGCNAGTQLGWEAMGLDAVICGHDHLYERIESKQHKKPLYLVDGCGGADLYDGKAHELCSNDYKVEYLNDRQHGAVKAVITKDKMTFYFYTAGNNKCADIAVITKP